MVKLWEVDFYTADWNVQEREKMFNRAHSVISPIIVWNGQNWRERWMRNRDYDLSTDKRHKNLRGLNGGADFYLDLVVQTAECLRIIVVCKNKIITGIVPIGFRSVCRRTDVAGYDNPSPPTHQRKKGKKNLYWTIKLYKCIILWWYNFDYQSYNYQQLFKRRS